MRDRCGLKINISLASSCRFCYWITRRSQKKRDVTHTDQVIDRRRLVSLTPVFSCSCGAIRITKVETFFFFFFLKSILYKKNRRKNTHDESRLTFMKKETFSRPLLGYWFKLLNDLNRHVSHGMKKQKKSLIHLAPLLYLLLYDGATASPGWQAPINLLLVLCV